MPNKVLNNNDLLEFRREIKEKDYESKFPHRDLWSKDDAVLKWISTVKEFKQIETEKKLKVIDLGAGDGCTPHIIASFGHNVTAIDIANTNHFCTNSLVNMVLNDALAEVKTMRSKTVDVFTDVCAVTHFNSTFDDKTANLGWKNIAEQVYRVLKPGGRFIITTDVDINSDKGEFISPKKIIKIIESSGLKLVGQYDEQSENTDFSIFYNGMTLQIASFCFEK
jgi:SAM-dependent methyltransferase